MIEKIEACGRLSETLTETQVRNVATYFCSLPSEAAMKLWAVLGEADCIENVIAIHKAESASGRSVSDALVEILEGQG